MHGQGGQAREGGAGVGGVIGCMRAWCGGVLVVVVQGGDRN